MIMVEGPIDYSYWPYVHNHV